MNPQARSQFLQALALQFSDIFEGRKNHKNVTEQKLRTQGFIQAGELLHICSRDDIQQLMEQIHQQVFGQSIAERQQQQNARQQAIADGDFDYFEQPAWERLGNNS